MMSWKTPETLDEWLDLYNEELRLLGFTTRTYMGFRRSLPLNYPGFFGKLMHDGFRRMWRRSQRVNRIRKHIDRLMGIGE